MKLCWFYQKLISFQTDSGKPPAAWLDRHCRECPSCEAYRESQTALVARLRSDARFSRTSPSPFLRGRIMAAIERDGRQMESPAGFFSPFRALIFSTAAILIISAVLLRTAVLPKRNEPTERVVAAAVQKRTDRIFQNMSIAPGKSLQEWEKNLDQPLELEIRRTLADARTAVDSLADSFLPEKLRKSLLMAHRD